MPRTMEYGLKCQTYILKNVYIMIRIVFISNIIVFKDKIRIYFLY